MKRKEKARENTSKVRMRQWLFFALTVVMSLFLWGCSTGSTENEEQEPAITEDGWYYSAEDVALYIHTYGHLPENFITKKEAGELGWEGGSVEKYKEGYAIGGDRFGNYEGLLPKKSGRQYYECDIDTNGGKSRGAKRLIFSNDGLIYYTEDHYETFTQLYGEE